jgi:hypothetical protein
MGPAKLAPGEGTWPGKLAPGGRDPAVSSTTPAGCGRGRDGRVCGEWRKGPGSASGAPQIRHRRWSSSQRCRERRSSFRLLQTFESRDHGLTPYGVVNPCSAFQALEIGPQGAGECDVLGIFVNGPASPTSLSGRTVTEVRLRVGLCPLPANPSRPGRLVAATPCRGRHETPGTHLGRPHGRPRPALNQPAKG